MDTKRSVVTVSQRRGCASQDYSLVGTVSIDGPLELLYLWLVEWTIRKRN